mmetsp:Transcript_11375/g.34051  ORF Transcript_11375/g.34051 Transcript_11375/m.34051 type:complete len:228 (-) Transcript_11375:630-1313(-)
MITAEEEFKRQYESTSHAAGLVQTKKTKISRLEKRMDELKTLSHARNILLTGERFRSRKLEGTLSNLKKNMEERESALEERELEILNLRRKAVTLDNFRFFLGQQIQQLVRERCPIMQQVGVLESHISGIYSELEAEQRTKYQWRQDLDSKDIRLVTVSLEATAARRTLRKREAYIDSFQRELSTLVRARTHGDLERGVRAAFRKFVKEDDAARKRQVRKGTAANHP